MPHNFFAYDGEKKDSKGLESLKEYISKGFQAPESKGIFLKEPLGKILLELDDEVKKESKGIFFFYRAIFL